MDPIVPIDAPKSKAAYLGTQADLIACGLAGFAALTALGYSVYYFTRFLENDSHLWGILSAFLLCFGVGAFGYIPAGIISRIAYQAHRQGAHRKNLIWAIILLFPWICLAISLVFISALPGVYSLPIFISILILMVWAVISLLRLKTG